MPDEDTNADGLVDVYDCRAGSKLSPSTSLVDSANQSITHVHSRKVFATAGGGASEIKMFSGTMQDFFNATGNSSSIDFYAADPIPDPCGLWEWALVPGKTDLYNLVASNAVGYKTIHIPTYLYYPTDPLDPASPSKVHYGFNQCISSCRSDAECVGAFYNAEESFEGTLNCTLVRDVGFDIDPESAFHKLQTDERGYVSGSLQFTYFDAGIISVCNP